MDAGKFVPLGDRVLLRRAAPEKVTSGGLYIPDNAKEKPVEGTVLAVGRGKVLPSGKLCEPSVKTGDRVLFGKYSGQELKSLGPDLVIVTGDDILGILGDD